MVPIRIEKFWTWHVWASVGLYVALTSSVHAQSRDYGPENRAWNGLQAFVQLARGEGVEVRYPARIEPEKLLSSDGLLIVFPAEPPPATELTSFVTRGGRLGIADDFGEAEALLAHFGIAREAPRAIPGERFLRGNPALLVATPSRAHALSEGLRSVVTNHPQVLWHARLRAILGFGAPNAALVLAGSVGAGHLVALGDPSVLTNNMLGFAGNRRFAQNLLRFLAPHARLWLALPDAAFVTREATRMRGLPPSVRAAIGRLARLRLPHVALQGATLVIAAVLLLAVALAVPKSGAFDEALASLRQVARGGNANRRRMLAVQGFAPAALTYRRGLEIRLAAALRAQPGAATSALVAALPSAALSPQHVMRMTQLLRTLEELARNPSQRRIGARTFHGMVRSGERILAALGDTDARDFSA